MTSHYTDNISERGDTASGFHCAGLRNSSFNLLCTQTYSYSSRGERETLPNHSDELLYKPSEQIFDPAQNNSSSSFPPPRQQTPIAAFWLSFKKSRFCFYKRASNDITPYAHFLLVWKASTASALSFPEEAGHFLEQVAH